MSCGAFTSYKYYTGICLECYKDIRPFNIKQQPSLYKIIEDAYFDDFNARFIYDDKVAKTILDFKFNDKTQNAKSLAKLVEKSLKELKPSNNTLIIPVPVHTKRLLTRKYNQASLLAKYLSRLSKITYSNNALKRVKHTPHQTGQSAKLRKKQLNNAFFANTKLIKDKDIILLDDVFTTGSTANLCAQELKEKGAKSVKVLTIAYTPL
tara:strand:+ start:1354 stop:1977 length:624 start_codon:yes stop_codon:yes gene_type:complete